MGQRKNLKCDLQGPWNNNKWRPLKLSNVDDTVARGVGLVYSCRTPRPAWPLRKKRADSSRLFLGAAGASIITAGVVVSALGNLNATLLAGRRLLYAMAGHGGLPRVFEYVHPRFHTPAAAILVCSQAGPAMCPRATG
jgi:amino acid permease-like protein